MISSTSNSMQGSTPRPRQLGWWAIPIGVLGYALVLGVWVSFVQPRFPSSARVLDPLRPRFIETGVEQAFGPVYLTGDATEDALLVIGDSRAQAGVVRPILEQYRIPQPALITGGLAQLRDLLAAARTLPARRLVVCLSPLSVSAQPNAGQRDKLTEERAGFSTARIDDLLDSELDSLRRRIVDPIQPAHWGSDWFREREDPEHQVGIYRGQLRKATRALRGRRLAELRNTLAQMQAQGWRIACVRLPMSPAIRKLEQRAFGDERFERLCLSLAIPYRDFSVTPYRTSDGSHLLRGEAGRFSHELAAWLEGIDEIAGE